MFDFNIFYENIQKKTLTNLSNLGGYEKLEKEIVDERLVVIKLFTSITHCTFQSMWSK